MSHLNHQFDETGETAEERVSRLYASPGGPLIGWLYDECRRRRQEFRQMADELGVTYGYINQLRSGLRHVRQISDDFAVILDPIRDFHNADENDATAMKSLTRHIGSYACSTHAAWLLVHHTNRAAALQDFGGSADAARGSTALTNAVRWQLNLSRPTRMTAKQFGLAKEQLHRHVLLDIPKANYVATTDTMVLTRGPHGVLMLAEGAA